MQALTAKELEYLADSMSNEDLLIKQCTVAAAVVQTPGLRQVISGMIDIHSQHYNQILTSLQQHQPLAPTAPQG
jgi:hypothetical protein